MSDYTPSQELAINAQGKNILVSASAGSGKTFVMIEKVIKLIIDGNVNVENILAVTYTKLAAEEMKEKLVKAVIKQINDGKNTEKMRQTLSEIPTADFSTFHSFCGNLLRTYFYACDIDPLFQIADESDALELKNRAIDRLFKKCYEENDEEFLYLVRIFRKGRGDKKLKENILKVFTFASSEKLPSKFLSDSANAIGEEGYENAKKGIYDFYIRKIKAFDSEFCRIEEECHSWGLSDYDDNFKDLHAFNSLAINCKDLPELISLSGICKFSKLKSLTSDDEKILELKGIVKNAKNELTNLYKDINQLFGENDDEFYKRQFLASSRATKGICVLTQSFADEYADIKKSEGKVDFSDLEHFTYKLLTENPDILSLVKEKYKYIFADEYQDVNGIQEAILSLISNDNMFMVGDVKQSIYAFRGCNPDIFSAKYDAYSSGEGQAIPLDRNFRSTGEVLNAVNNVFSGVMTTEFGGIDYSANKMEKCDSYPVGSGSATMHIIEGKKDKPEPPSDIYDIYADATEDKVEDAFAEGVLIGQIIERELGKDIYVTKPKGHYRPATLGDFAVITRSKKGFTDAIIKQLIKMGIPVSADVDSKVGDYPEIRLMIDILKLISFYADDVPLASVLKSSLCGLNESQLAKIRKASKPKKITFYECVKYYEATFDDEISQKLKEFETYFEGIRLLSEFTGAGEILTRILREKELDMEILASPLGKIRLARVERFISESVVGGSKLSVNAFLERLEYALDEIKLAEIAGEDTVKVMSIHASKGLEFPIVIIPGLGRRFNRQDEAEDILYNRNLGIALKSYDEDTMRVSENLRRTHFKKLSSVSEIMEEARVFYVAMTRASCKLHMISTKSLNSTHSEFTRINAGSLSDFVSTQDMPIEKHDYSTLNSVSAENVETINIGEGRKSLIERIEKNLNFKYPYEYETQLPLKRAVTKLTENVDKGNLYDIVLPNYNDEPHDTKISVADKGTAYHRFLEKCDFNEKDIDNELIALLNAGNISKEQFDLYDRDLLLKIKNNSLFASLSGYTIYREQPFVAPFTARELDIANSDGEILVQGIIDLLAVKNDRAIIVDYKLTSLKTDEEIRKKYTAQLSIYKKAVVKATKYEVEKVIILNLNTGIVTEIF